jgi:hypothetical protein
VHIGGLVRLRDEVLSFFSMSSLSLLLSLLRRSRECTKGRASHVTIEGTGAREAEAKISPAAEKEQKQRAVEEDEK